MKMRYSSPADVLWRFLGMPPMQIEVEVLEMDFERGMALVKKPIPKNCILNIMRARSGKEPLEHVVEHVAKRYLSPIEAKA